MKASTKALVIIKSVVVASVAVFTLSGCMVVVDGDKESRHNQSEWESREADNRDAIAQLDLGMSSERVLNKMGTPDFDEQLILNDKRYRVLYYRTQRVTGDGKTTRDECTPLVFADGNLQGWGESQLRVIENQM